MNSGLKAFLFYKLIFLAVLWVVLLIFVSPLYDFGTRILRKFKMDKLADLRERTKAYFARVIGPHGNRKRYRRFLDQGLLTSAPL